MGVYRTDHLMYAADVKHLNIDFWEKYEGMMDGDGSYQTDVVNDGMCGEYTLIGKIITTADQYEGWGTRNITDLTPSEADKATIFKAAYGEIPELAGHCVEFKLLIVSHYS